MSNPESPRWCRSRSQFGACGLPAHNDLDHAVPIGDNVWFGYHGRGRTATPVGYGKFHDGVWEPL